MDKIISDLIALKLGISPADARSHSLIRQKLEELMEPYRTPKKNSFPNPTQSVIEQAILFLIDSKLCKKYLRYFAK